MHFPNSQHNLMYPPLNSQLQSSAKWFLFDVTWGSDWCPRLWSSWHWKHEWACHPLHCTSAKLKTRSTSDTVFTNNIFYRFLNETMALLSSCFSSVSKPRLLYFLCNLFTIYLISLFTVNVISWSVNHGLRVAPPTATAFAICERGRTVPFVSVYLPICWLVFDYFNLMYVYIAT